MTNMTWHGLEGRQGTPLKVAMLLYPGFTLIDLAGPESTLALHSDIRLVWKRLEPVISDTGVSLAPNATFADCPDDLDILFVPGGLGTAEMMEDAEVLGFLRSRGERARYVTSVCSGSLILAAAGLLKGYQATTHWSSLDVLAAFGVEVVEARVVTDRNRISGGGATAGIDFGLMLLAQLRGEPAARMTQLALEYDPAPPFDAGSPKGAGPEITQQALALVADLKKRTMAIAEKARTRIV